MKLISYIDRNYNLFFHRERCAHRKEANFKYNDIVSDGTYQMRYMGNNWYYIQKYSLPHADNWTSIEIRKAIISKY